jgi:hypothetical protein
MKNRNEVRISMTLNIHIAGREINIEKKEDHVQESNDRKRKKEKLTTQ